MGRPVGDVTKPHLKKVIRNKERINLIPPPLGSAPWGKPKHGILNDSNSQARSRK